MALRGGLAVGAAGLALLALGCSEAPPDEVGQEARAKRMDSGLDPPSPLLVGNWLRNPGFEDGYEKWGQQGRTRWIGSKIVEQPVHSGRKAAHLAVSWQPGERVKSVKVFGASQDISPPRFPDRVSGYYRVEHWENASEQTDLYIQVVVGVVGDPRTASLVSPEDPEESKNLTNYQLRYYLAGVTEPAFTMGNGRIKMVGVGPPKLGEWIRFELPVRADFEELWGVVPADYDFLRVFFEARWDNKKDEAALRADVYYDLFAGFDELSP